MDFDIGNLVYIILTLIFIIVGAMGNKKKSRPQVYDTFDEEKEEKEKAFDDFGEKFNQFFGEKEAPREKRETIEEEVDEGTDTVEEEYNKAEALYKEKKEEGIYKLEDHIQEISDKTKLKMPSRRKKDSNYIKRALMGFDPRKAYLYSEIFKPKYF